MTCNKGNDLATEYGLVSHKLVKEKRVHKRGGLLSEKIRLATELRNHIAVCGECSRKEVV